MRNLSYTPDRAIARKTKPVAFMDMTNASNKEKPDFIFPVGVEIWTAPFDEFMDAGFEGEYNIIPITSASFPKHGDARIAFDYFYNGADSGEYGEPMMPFEGQHRRDHYAKMFKHIVGHEIIFKEVD